MSRKYCIALLVVTLACVLGTFVVLWSGGRFQPVMPVVMLYLALVTLAQHYLIVQSAKKDPRTFIRNFMGAIVAVVLLHLVVLLAWSLTHIATAQPFLICFCAGFLVFLTFETVALVLATKRIQGH